MSDSIGSSDPENVTRYFYEANTQMMGKSMLDHDFSIPSK